MTFTYFIYNLGAVTFSVAVAYTLFFLLDKLEEML